MTLPLKLLFVEDNPDDVRLALRELNKAGMEVDWQRVDTLADYIAAFDLPPDVILADYNLPQFSGIDTIRVLREHKLDIPLIVVSGTVGEEVAVSCIKLGATDYLLKDRLARLPEAIKRAVADRQLRAEKLKADEAAAFMASIVATSSDAIIGELLDGTILSWNAGAETIYGYQQEEAVGGSVTMLAPPDRVDEITGILARLARGETITNFETKRLRKDGQLIDVSITVSPILDAEGTPKAASIITRDITARKAAERALERANRVYRTLSSGNQALLRSVDELTLLNDVCRAIVEVGGYSLAWVGYKIDDKDKTIRPMAYFGIGSAEIPQAKLTWAENGLGLEAACTAIRTGKPVVMQNLATDPTFITYRARALELGHNAAAIFPLIIKETVVGILSVYAREPDAFSDTEVALLAEMADDMAFGIETLHTREERRRAVDALAQSEAHFKLLFYANPHPMWVYDVETLRFLEVNDSAIALYGFSRDEFLAMTILDIRPEEDAPKVLQSVQADQDQPYASSEWQHRLKDGTLIDVEIATHSLEFAGRSARLVAAFNITERKRAAAAEHAANIALEQQNERVTALFQVGKLVNSTLDVTQILDFVADEAMRVTKATHGLVLVANVYEGVFERRSLRGFTAEEAQLAATRRLRLDQELNGQAYQTRQVVHVDDVRAQPDYFPLIQGTRSELVIPILREGMVLGNIDLQSPEVGAISEESFDYLQALAEQAALAINNARLYEALESQNDFLEQAINERTAELQATKQRVESILSSVGDALLVLNLDGRIQQVNPAFERQTGYSVYEAELQDHHDLLRLEFGSKGDYQGALEVLKPGQMWQGQTKVTRKDGSIYDAHFSIAPVRDASGKLRLLVGSIRDITPLKEAERAKDQFVSNVSHELRTPITSLKLNLNLLMRDPSRQGIYVGRLQREIDRLNDLIEDLLRLSRLEQGSIQLDLKPLDLNRMIGQFVEDRAPLAENRGLAFTSEPDMNIALVEGDAGLLEQALSVLVTNAFNYTPAGGTVTIRMQQKENDRRRWVGFSVSDTGPGISPHEQPRLFQRFFRGEAGRKSGAPGTGLGLAIAKEIVQRHKGRLELQSDGIQGNGTTFSVWLPVGEIQSI